MEELEKTEAAVVSCVMSNETAIMQVYPLLKPQMFSHPALAFAYGAACSLYEKGLKVDLVTHIASRREQLRHVAYNPDRPGGMI